MTLLTKAQSLNVYRWIGKQIANNMIIREASELDIHAIYDLWAVERSPADTSCDCQRATRWVGLISGNHAGFVELVRNSADSAWGGHWLYSLWVRTRWRGFGLGEKLVRAVVERSQVEGSDKLDLMVYEDNTRVVCLYHKLGFMHITFSEIEALLLSEQQTSGRRRIVMRKWLGGN